MKKLSIILLLLCFQSARAEVFTLAPFSGDSKGDPADLLHPLDLWTEPVIINGVSCGLKISLLDLDLRTSLAQLRKNFPEVKFAKNGSSALLEIKNKDGSRKRMYLVELGGKYPVVQFSMDLPAKIPDSPEWPKELPLPPDSKPESTMEFPNRKSTYGYFTTSLSPDEALNSMKTQLETEGWVAYGSHNNPMTPSKGDVFVNKNPVRMMVVSFSESETGEVRGAVYQKPIQEQ